MKNLKQLIKFIFLPLVLIYGCQTAEKLTDAQKLERFFNKKKVNILVTDSGLGGVSVAADVYERFINSGVFENINITFFNAQPHIKSGYNSMETTEQKVQVFENALNAMQENFAPDLILIACNTLSVIYPLTPFSNYTEIPVIGIVETGVDLIQNELEQDSTAKVLIFATKTTIEKNTHKNMLIDRGIEENRIITEACPKLAGAIERGTHSEETLGLVNQYVSEALSKTPDNINPLYVSFNCTHYGYINDVFEAKFKEKNRPAYKLLDPNPKMGDFIFNDKYLHRYENTDVSIKVVSQPELNVERIESIGNLIEQISPKTASAMREYEFTPELFEWKSITNQKGK
jgi:glutamate racemase